MRIISWNARGINFPNKRAQVKQQLDVCGADVVVLQETKTSYETFEYISKKWNKWKYFHFLAHGASRGLITLWNAKLVNAPEGSSRSILARGLLARTLSG